MRNNKTFIYISILIGIFALFGYVVVRLVQENNRIRNELPYFMYGERIEYFDLVGMDNKRLDASFLKNSQKPSLIFIFTSPCSPCNKNILFWKKLADIFKNKVSIYGIILDTFPQAYGFSESSQLNFRLYIPDNIDDFKNKMRLKFNIAQTIICKANRVKYVSMGDLNVNEVTKILGIINEI